MSLVRQAYLEFDLEAMFEGETYGDFTLLWLLFHQSRVENTKPEDFWLERWSSLAQEKGIPLLASKYTMFETSGRLYGAGLPSCGLFELTLRQWREAMGEKE